jgi:hypothetical protein
MARAAGGVRSSAVSCTHELPFNTSVHRGSHILWLCTLSSHSSTLPTTTSKATGHTDVEIDVDAGETDEEIDEDAGNIYVTTSASWTLTPPIPWDAIREKSTTCDATCETYPIRSCLMVSVEYRAPTPKIGMFSGRHLNTSYSMFHLMAT